MKPFLLLFLSFTLSLAWKNNTLIYISLAIAKGGNLSDCWICHQRVWSVHNAKDFLVLPVINFSSIPNVAVYLYIYKSLTESDFYGQNI